MDINESDIPALLRSIRSTSAALVAICECTEREDHEQQTAIIAMLAATIERLTFSLKSEGYRLVLANNGGE